MPAKTQKFGSVETTWEELDPGVAAIRSKGGSFEDRYLAEQVLLSKLKAHNYERAYFSFDPEHKTSSWDDIMAKANRLIKSNQVELLRNSYNVIAAHVVGDHDDYNVEIGRDDPNSRAITTWQCECPWDDFAWGRTRQWKKYEGRPCAHVLAAFWQAQSAPLDEELEEGQALPPGQRGFSPQTPADIPGVGQQQRLPFQEAPEGGFTAPMQPPGDVQPAPGMEPAAPDILPPFPGEQMQLVPPGQLAPGQPGITVSEPGARQPTPFNPMQNPSTYSKVGALITNQDWQDGEDGKGFLMKNGEVHVWPTWDEEPHHAPMANHLGVDYQNVESVFHVRSDGNVVANTPAQEKVIAAKLGIDDDDGDWHFGAAEFNNSDMVRLNEDEYGVAEGKSEAHGAGSYRLVTKNSIGEVLGTDPTTGWVDVIFPIHDAGPMEPYHIRALVEPGQLTPMPNVKKPGPFLRRR
jgi:hypothetical protein